MATMMTDKQLADAKMLIEDTIDSIVRGCEHKVVEQRKFDHLNGIITDFLTKVGLSGKKLGEVQRAQWLRVLRKFDIRLDPEGADAETPIVH